MFLQVFADGCEVNEDIDCRLMLLSVELEIVLIHMLEHALGLVELSV